MYDTAERIVSGILNRDIEAETALVEKFNKRLLYILTKRTGDAELAKDLSQEAFKIVIERLRSKPLEKPHQLANFIQKTAINLYIAEMRKISRRNTVADTDFLDTVPHSEEGQYNELWREQACLAVRQLIFELNNERDRKVLYGHYIEEKDKADICRELELSHRHFDRVISRARSRFRALLTQKTSDELFDPAI